VADISGYLEIPPEKEMGDYAFPCFKLSRALHKGPPQIAGMLATAIDAPNLCEAKQQGGYLNFFLHRSNFAQQSLNAVLDAGDRYGASDVGANKTICLDFSSINIAKRFHIGHLSTTMIGQSLRRIYTFLGYQTVAINYLGDWGTQFGKLLCAYQRWGNQAEVERDGVEALTRLYVRFHEEAESDPALEDEGRKWFKAIEDGDAEAVRLFTLFKELTLRDTQRVYDMLGVTFDSYNGEAFFNDKMGRVIDELTQKKLLTVSEGASIVDLDEEHTGMPPCLVLKKDGATLYATRDIAAALWRMDEYHFDKCLYVVAYQQDLHFRQWFKVVEKMGYAWA
ncbi:MAG: arginine--tRNA ligase, partial [Clostridia bacterium]